MRSQLNRYISKARKLFSGTTTLKRLPGDIARQSGSIIVMAALALPVVAGLAGLAVDMGRAYAAQRELKNAASAAAMAGAGCLYGSCASQTALQTSPYAAPYWLAAEAQALLAIKNNTVMGTKLNDGVITSGYYDTSSKTMTLHTALSASFIPGSTQVPAVQVNISKAAGHNGGAINTLFMQVLPGAPKTISVSADGTFGFDAPSSGGTPAIPTAGVVTSSSSPSSPRTVMPGTLFPVAISKCMYDTYWNSGSGDDNGDGVRDGPGPKNDPRTGMPYVFEIGSSYHYTPCASGQWTSFATDANDVPTIRGLIANGNPTALSIGNNTWIEPGTKNTLYSSVESCSMNGDKSCEYAVLPVVADSAINTRGNTHILGFACVHIDSAVGGSVTDIQVEMVAPTNPRCVVAHSAQSSSLPCYGATGGTARALQ